MDINEIAIELSGIQDVLGLAPELDPALIKVQYIDAVNKSIQEAYNRLDKLLGVLAGEPS